MKNEIVARLLKKIPLEIRLKVSTEMAMIDLLTEMGYREDKAWTEEEDEKLHILVQAAERLTKWHLKEIKQWEEDGRPNDIYEGYQPEDKLDTSNPPQEQK